MKSSLPPADPRLALLQSRLRDAPEFHGDSSSHRLAAVLMLIQPGGGDLEILLTRRTEHLPHHAGQISFPGGSLEPADENLFHTALREAHEEIGLDPALVNVLGALEPVHLPSGFRVTPVVGTMDTLPPLRPDPGEVEEIFTLPLSLVLDPAIYLPGSRLINGIKRDFYFFEFNEYYVWGATAKMLRNLALAFHGV